MINYEELSERKLKILHAVIQNYLETGEPVGSRTISKYTDLNLSSATIRNEMADLEEMGYIIQPHTSAGRIPSDKGYRLYVDMLMEEKEQELNEMQEQMLDKADKMDQLLKWIFPLNSFLNSCMSSMRITHDQNFHLFHPSLFTKLSLHSDFICQSISSSRTHVRLGA